MKLQIFSVLLGLALSTSAYAALLSTTTGSHAIEGVKISTQGEVEVSGQKLPVTTIGAGLRAKKVLIATVRVYVAELLSSDASKFVRTESESLKTLEESRTIAIRLTFLRSVDAPTVQSSFKEALVANKVNVAEATLAKFLANVSNGGDAAASKSMTIVTTKNADLTETISYEDTNGKVSSVTGPQGTSAKIMSIWLGTPADDGLKSLKLQLLKQL